MMDDHSKLEPIYLANVALYLEGFSTFKCFQLVSKRCVLALKMLHINPPKLTTGINYLFGVLPNINTLTSSIEYAENELKGCLLDKITWIDASSQISTINSINKILVPKIRKVRILPSNLQHIDELVNLKILIVEQLVNENIQEIDIFKTQRNIENVVLYYKCDLLRENTIKTLDTISLNNPTCKFTIVCKKCETLKTQNVILLEYDISLPRERQFNVIIDQQPTSKTLVSKPKIIIKQLPIKEEKIVYIIQKGIDHITYKTIGSLDKMQHLFFSEKVRKITFSLLGKMNESEKFIECIQDTTQLLLYTFIEPLKFSEVSTSLNTFLNLVEKGHQVNIEIDAKIEDEIVLLDFVISFVYKEKTKKSSSFEQKMKTIEKYMKGKKVSTRVSCSDVSYNLDFYIDNLNLTKYPEKISFDLLFADYNSIKRPLFQLLENRYGEAHFISNFFVTNLSFDGFIFSTIDIPYANKYTIHDIKTIQNNHNKVFVDDGRRKYTLEDVFVFPKNKVVQYESKHQLSPRYGIYNIKSPFEDVLVITLNDKKHEKIAQPKSKNVQKIKNRFRQSFDFKTDDLTLLDTDDENFDDEDSELDSTQKYFELN
ncbi:hypothetical protein EIN_087990 [Entamoeba invadens IP1]|uniref:hypothetical protein n=1 Tax=Entamoeba invadens IP1 TaxID=370355 RepID=UPI0002C3DF00|nr:hypothetical protein EIN_087990 [Entamoeba invadens IP1]ELP85457.1 hypothetical protein EIN_087990 [Entamoeba invadens IP1]|eukprot:XP_004184803.1 hypothetical protein EIN_087990 [Entamoeba invadens IP1]